MRHILFQFGFLAISLMMATSVAVAQDKHHALTLLEGEGMSVESLGNAYGMEGWIIRDDQDRVQYAYSTPQGGLVMGMLYGPDGMMVTNKQIADYLDKNEGQNGASATQGGGSRDNMSQGGMSMPAVPVAEADAGMPSMTVTPAKEAAKKAGKLNPEQIYAQTETLNWFSVGAGTAPYFYTFVNPTCVHCKNFYKAMKPLIDQGQVQVRFIPFGRHSDNKRTSSALLSSDNPAQAWDAYVAGDESVLGEANATDAGYDLAQVNTKMWVGMENEVKGLSAPFTIYRSPATGEIKVVLGVPENTMLMMADFIK